MSKTTWLQNKVYVNLTQRKKKGSSYPWALQTKNVDCLTRCCTIEVHQMHPDSFQSSRKRQADLGKSRSPRNYRTYSLLDTDDQYLSGLIGMWPPPPSRLACSWLQESLVGHLLDCTYDMRTFQSQIWGLDPGWVQRSRAFQSGRWGRASHSMDSENRIVNIFSSVGHAIN